MYLTTADGWNSDLEISPLLFVLYSGVALPQLVLLVLGAYFISFLFPNILSLFFLLKCD